MHDEEEGGEQDHDGGVSSESGDSVQRDKGDHEADQGEEMQLPPLPREEQLKQQPAGSRAAGSFQRAPDHLPKLLCLSTDSREAR